MALEQIQIISTPEAVKAFISDAVNDALKNIIIPDNKIDSTNEKPICGKELCAFLNITEPTLIRWRQKGRIPHLRIGSKLMYQKSSVLAALSNLKAGKA